MKKMNKREAIHSDDAMKIAQAGQEQAVAAWINYLNQVRLERLTAALRELNINLHDSLASIDTAFNEINKLVENNRGGFKGLHGFIAEVAETGIGNARSLIHGGDKIYQWVDNNGPADLIRSGISIQQKFYAAGNRFGLRAIAEHLDRYPDFIENGNRYQIPADHYEIVRKLYLMPREQAGKLLSRAGEGPSFKDWERVQDFFNEESVPFESLEPSYLEYGQVQQKSYEATLTKEKSSLRQTSQDRRGSIQQAHKPTLKQGAQAAAGAAAMEGGMAFFLAIVAKRKEGKKLRDFTNDDWEKIAGETGLGFAKGAVRGLSIYILSNATETAASTASAIVTAAFGVANQANLLRRGEITEQEFLENAELIAIESAISGLSSLIGQTVIPIPILGAVIGNTVGMVLYKAVSDSVSKREADIINSYIEEQRILDEKFSAEYQELIEHLETTMAQYIDLLESAFSPDIGAALDGSITLAIEIGVDPELILDSAEKTGSYFLD